MTIIIIIFRNSIYIFKYFQVRYVDLHYARVTAFNAAFLTEIFIHYKPALLMQSPAYNEWNVLKRLKQHL